MSLMVTKAEGVTVLTFTSNPKSKWPLIFLLLHTLKKQLGSTRTVLGTLQILVGIMNLGFGCILGIDPCIWLGGVLIAAGIIYILLLKFSSPCLVSLTVLMSLASAALALTTIVFYLMDLTLVLVVSSCYHTWKMMQGGLDVMMIMLGVLDFCVLLLHKKKKGDKMEDPELHRPLLVEVFSSHVH